MDDTDWAATGLFSPSKARLVQAQAKDWSFVDAWLAKKYVSSKVPGFERNEDTLQALLTLISLNETADEQRNVVERVEKSALQYYTKQKSEPGDALYSDIRDHLYQQGHDSIETLAKTSLLLNRPVRKGIDELALGVVSLQMQLFETQAAEIAAKEQTTVLRKEYQHLTGTLAFLRSDEYKAPESVVEDTAQWLKGTKHLRAKIGEYDERLAATRPSQPLLSMIKDVNAAVTDEASQNAQLTAITNELEALRQFPAQPAAAREMLARAKEELKLLTSEWEAASA